VQAPVGAVPGHVAVVPLDEVDPLLELVVFPLELEEVVPVEPLLLVVLPLDEVVVVVPPSSPPPASSTPEVDTPEVEPPPVPPLELEEPLDWPPVVDVPPPQPAPMTVVNTNEPARPPRVRSARRFFFAMVFDSSRKQGTHEPGLALLRLSLVSDSATRARSSGTEGKNPVPLTYVSLPRQGRASLRVRYPLTWRRTGARKDRSSASWSGSRC
jgi:hypothetical protein